MLRTIGARRRPIYVSHLCALASAILLLFSVSLLYSRISSNDTVSGYHHDQYDYRFDAMQQNHQFSDTEDGRDRSSVDRIDELDFVVEESADEDDESEQDRTKKSSMSGYYVDHTLGVIRRAAGKQSIDEWDFDYNGADSFGQDLSFVDGIETIGNDDMPIDERIRSKMEVIDTIEDALLLKVGTGKRSGLRNIWGDWFEKKGDFLRRDRMFRSNLEALNPLNNPILQDPDGIGISSFSRGDKIVRKWFLEQIRKSEPLPRPVKASKNVVNGDSQLHHRNLLSSSEAVKKKTVPNKVRWGYYPGLDSKLPFSQFVESFFRTETCSFRVFMVWNSPPWMFGVRHQRSLESLLSINRNACVLLLTETLELDFFKNTFLKDGFKVAIAMPNLDELLKNTPAHIFASAWYQWRKIKLYPIHYSELIRLAVLYKYGGIYIDSDIIILKPLKTVEDSIGRMNQYDKFSLNGAVMGFKKHSPFLKFCLEEFASTYRPNFLTWNGADLLTRVAKNLTTKTKSLTQYGLTVQPSSVFFPISKRHILRFFSNPETESAKIQQDLIFERIIKQSQTFHFWNGLTFSLVPEVGSLVAKLLDFSCIYCHDSL